MHELFNLRWYIQHLMDENEYENENPLTEHNWIKQANLKFIKYVIHHQHSMTSEQLKRKPFKEIIKKQDEKLDTEEANKDEEETTTSSELSEHDSESDTSVAEASEPPQTFQVHNILNNSICDGDNSSEPEDNTSDVNSVYQIQPYTENGEQNNEQETKLLTTNFEVKVENRKVEGLITYSTDQQIFKFKVNSGNNQDAW